MSKEVKYILLIGNSKSYDAKLNAHAYGNRAHAAKFATVTIAHLLPLGIVEGEMQELMSSASNGSVGNGQLVAAKAKCRKFAPNCGQLVELVLGLDRHERLSYVASMN